MAAPNVTGSAVLLAEYLENQLGSTPQSATTKGLLIHTATDSGNVGPDYTYGWGLVNVAQAADFVTSSATGASTYVLQEASYTGTEWTVDIVSDGSTQLKATLV